MERTPDDFCDETTTDESQFGVVVRNRKSEPASLEQLEGPDSPRRFVLEKEDVVIGRSQNADILVDSPQVSRNHMLLKKVGNEHSCVDLKSRNGVYLNGLKIHSAVLREGDTIQLGNVVFLFHEGT